MCSQQSARWHSEQAQQDEPERTPTDNEVLESWVARNSPDQPTALDLVDAYEAFKRWLAAHDAAVRADEREQDESEAMKVAAQRAERIRELEAEVENAQWATRVDPCEITHTEPYDFDQCLAHDRTLPRGGECDHAGKSAMDHETDLHMKQRGRAVRAEMRAEAAEARLEKVRVYVETLSAGPPLGSNWMRWADQVIVRLRSILDGDSDDR